MQQLPPKDQAIFRSIVKFYETKQYKKGVKAADSILKKHPEHGETLCMKGLTLSYMEKKEEAYELVRKGLRFDIKSHVCWHVFGLLYRQDKDYMEAVKCYRNALRYDADNIQILRDLAVLQIHRRDLNGFAETRRKLLQVKPSNRLNWLGYAVAEHLCKGYEFAWTCIDNYEKTFKDDSIGDYDNSELYLYKATIMEEAGKFEEALELLNKHEKDIVDKLGFEEMKGRLCMFLKKYSEAADIYKNLIKQNPEHHIYILAYMANLPQFHRFWPAMPAPREDSENKAEDLPSTICSFPVSLHPQGMPIWGWLAPEHALKPNSRVAVGRRMHKRGVDSYEPLCKLNDEEEEAVCKLFDELLEEHKRSDSLERILLFFVNGKRFEHRLDVYLRSRIRKGIPSLFRTLRPLYFQDGKAELIEPLVLKYIDNLNKDESTFGSFIVGKAEVQEEPPSSLLFSYMLASEHYDFVGNTDKALHYADLAIEHTPTFVEIYMTKARIYKHAGDSAKSALVFDEVREMDLADRFLNTQSVRAFLRVDDIKAGKEKALLFSQSKEVDAPESTNLHDMQCMWYESAVGRSHYRQKNYGMALKEFNETFKHFSDIAEDQFDFHNYCLRKTTLKAYVAMLRMQEKLYSHKFYRRAAKDAIRIYVDLYDQKLRGEGKKDEAKDDADENAEMSAAQKKAAKNKNKRAAKATEAKVVPAAVGGKPKKVDDDPVGAKLLEKDPMEEANKLAKNLVLYSQTDVATHVLTYDVASRQGKWLHCLQSLIRLWELAHKDVCHFKLIAPLGHFCFEAKLDDPEMPSPVREVILSEAATIFGESKAFKDVAALRAAAKKVVDKVQKTMESTPAMPLLELLCQLKCLKSAGRDCSKFLEKWNATGAMSLKECRKMLDYLAAEYGKDSKTWQKFRDRCTAKDCFPLMVIA